MLKKGQKIQEASLSGGINTGIGYKKYHPQIVALYEEHEARVSVGYRLSEWTALQPEERAFEVAHHRMKILVHNHREAEIAKKTKGRGRK